MSASSAPINAQRFREALVELPLSSLHAKAAELRNSVAHLQSSNEQLQAFADDGDKVCAEAIEENLEVIGRMHFRIQMLKDEVENRGMMWVEDSTNGKPEAINGQIGHANSDTTGGPAQMASGADSGGHQTDQNNHTPNRLTDAELARRIQERLEQDDEDGGMHI